MPRSNSPSSTTIRTGVGPALDRRAFLVASGLGLSGLGLGGLSVPAVVQGADASGTGSSPSGQAKTTILIWLSGGASHIDTWDMKPEAPLEYRGPFKTMATSAPGVTLCEHLPKLAKQAHHLAVVNSLGHFRRGTGDHHAGYYYNLTGHRPDPSFPQLLNSRTPRATDWPFMGSVVGYKAPLHPYLPQTITLPMMPGAPSYTRPGQFAARLGVEYDPLYVHGSLKEPEKFTVPALALQGDVTPERLQSRREMLSALNAVDRSFQDSSQVTTFSRHQLKAFSLLGSDKTKEAFDLSQETPETRARYGNTINGMSMLMARRLAEVGVPFVSVFWHPNPAFASKCKSAGSWDTHGNNFNCLKDFLLPEFDQAFATLVEDMAQRGSLDHTLLLVNSEMGRMPKIGDRRSGGVKGAGRDHWTHCMSVLMAGGGIRGGQTYGKSDRHAEFPADLPVAPEDISKTVYYAMGFDDLTATDAEGRPTQLLEEGKPIRELF